MTEFPTRTVLAALLSISLSPPAIAGDAMERFATLSVCQTASNAVWQAWMPRIRQAVEAGDATTAPHLVCQAGHQAAQACDDAMRAVSGLPPPPPQQVEMARAQAKAAMLAHGMTPCN
jgi:hypothetical protein